MVEQVRDRPQLLPVVPGVAARGQMVLEQLPRRVRVAVVVIRRQRQDRERREAVEHAELVEVLAGLPCGLQPQLVLVGAGAQPVAREPGEQRLEQRVGVVAVLEERAHAARRDLLDEVHARTSHRSAARRGRRRPAAGAEVVQADAEREDHRVDDPVRGLVDEAPGRAPDGDRERPAAVAHEIAEGTGEGRR